MKSIMQFVVLAAWAGASIQGLMAEEKVGTGSPNDPVTLKGKITCAKSELNDSPTCHTVLVVRDPDVGPNENDREIVYYFDDASSKKYHKLVCEQGVNGTVVGLVSEKDGVKSIKVMKLAFKNQGVPK